MNFELKDGHISLRPCRPEHAEIICRAVTYSLPELIPWLPWCHEEYAIEETRAWLATRVEAWEKNLEYDFIILDNAGCLLGACGLNRIDWENRVSGLGYWVRSDSTKRGIASAAARRLAGFGFGELKLNRIEIMAAKENHASQRVAEKLGAVREGIARSRFIVHGQACDMVMFSLLPADLS